MYVQGPSGSLFLDLGMNQIYTLCSIRPNSSVSRLTLQHCATSARNFCFSLQGGSLAWGVPVENVAQDNLVIHQDALKNSLIYGFYLFFFGGGGLRLVRSDLCLDSNKAFTA